MRPFFLCAAFGLRAYAPPEPFFIGDLECSVPGMQIASRLERREDAVHRLSRQAGYFGKFILCHGKAERGRELSGKLKKMAGKARRCRPCVYDGHPKSADDMKRGKFSQPDPQIW